MNFNEGYPEECSSVPDINTEDGWYDIDDPRIFDKEAETPDFGLNMFNGGTGEHADSDDELYCKLFKNFLKLPDNKRQTRETQEKLFNLLGIFFNDYNPTEKKTIKKRGRPTKEKVPPPPPEPKILKTADKKAYNKEYNEKYYQKRKEKNETIICNICNGRYNKFSKTKHDLTNNHIFIFNKLNNII